MILFVLGLIIGGCMGMLMMALCVIAKKKRDEGEWGRKKMNIIRKVFRSLSEPIQVEARFPLMAWVLLLIAVFIGKVEIVCQ